MSIDPVTGRLRQYLFFCFIVLVAAGCVQVVAAVTGTQTDPSVYLDFNEGSGTLALDASGHGNTGTIVGAARTGSGGCGSALRFNGAGDYVSVPYTAINHPEKEITVSAWFYVDSFAPQTLVSSYDNGGYWLGFGDGNDLWWIIKTEKSGVVTVPVQHDGMTPHQWHHVTGTYDGETARIYLDGALRNRVNASGRIRYEQNNYVLLGADAGAFLSSDPACSRYLKGGLDEVRIYDTALEYGSVMDDRFRCSAEPRILKEEPLNETAILSSCTANSGSLHLEKGESATRTLMFSDKLMNGTWVVMVPPGSTLIVRASDLFDPSYSDAWYIEIADGKQRIDRSIAFPNTYNTPIEGIIPSGNATVYVRYFDGKYRFPASVEVTFRCVAPPPLPPIIPQNILSSPGIVIYTASWATLIAVLIVVIWLHRRKTQRRAQETSAKGNTEADGKQNE